MADFVAVLRKTVSALGENTPEMREKVYEKARSTIEAKLAALDPQPPAAVIDRQRKALDDAIAVLRADYAEASEPEDDFDDLISSFDAPTQVSTPPASPLVVAPDRPVDPAPEEPVSGTGNNEVQPEPVQEQDDQAFSSDFTARPEAASAPHTLSGSAPRSSSGFAGSRVAIAVALVVILVITGGVYALWMNRDGFTGSGPASTEVAQEDVVTTAEELTETAPAEEPALENEEEVALIPPAEEPPAEQTPTVQQLEPAAAAVEKFTQRLLSDGSEVDDGPAGGQRTIGEGTSVANVAPADEQAGGDEAQQAAGGAPAPQADAAPTTIAVGQRAIFYEERTSSAQGSAEMGSIVWSVVQESPGGDLPPEPAIRAEASIPAKDVQLRMTIRRNGDQTLPAAHIVEMIFLTPEGFEGGAVSNVSRVAFKETEQAAGNPLIGIPAKIADGFFLIALSDSPNEIDSNIALLGSRSWIDIPIVYQSGRRALLSLEKGIPGERVFQETLQAWQASSSAG